MSEPTIQEHLAAMGYDENWIEELATMIVEFTGNDPAIATARAVDMVAHSRFGKAVAYHTKGFMVIEEAIRNEIDLSPNQRETLRQLLLGMHRKLENLMQKKG